ncbi:hypothetical protein HanRHA438_Chr05g0203171 [Helianthus annuus]|nr:hypothetical protein HanRHA438_Chr05g0203171 [Helianthus annuus]
MNPLNNSPRFQVAFNRHLPVFLTTPSKSHLEYKHNPQTQPNHLTPLQIDPVFRLNHKPQPPIHLTTLQIDLIVQLNKPILKNVGN